MRVAVWDNLPSGGGKRALFYHVRGLVQRGHSVECWCPPTADQSYLPLSKHAPVHVLPLHWQPHPTRNPVARVVRRYRQVARHLAAFDEHCRACAEQINKGGFDILFSNACTSFRTASIARHVTIPSTIYLGEPYRWLYEALPEPPWAAPPSGWSLPSLHAQALDAVKLPGMRLQVREEVRSAKAFDVILVNSFYSRESVLRAYGLDSKVCYLGIDPQLFRRLDVPREPFIIGLGAIVPEKNVEFAVRAVAAAGKPPPRLVWVGNVSHPDYSRRVQEVAESLRVPFDVRQRVADDELVRLLNTASAMIYAPRLEPFGLAPLEANSCGLPVVAVAEGGVRETVLDGCTGLLVENDAEQAGAALRRLLTEQEFRERLGRTAAAEVSAKWTLNAMVDRLESRLAEAIAAHHRSGADAR